MEREVRAPLRRQRRRLVEGRVKGGVVALAVLGLVAWALVLVSQRGAQVPAASDLLTHAALRASLPAKVSTSHRPLLLPIAKDGILKSDLDLDAHCHRAFQWFDTNTDGVIVVGELLEGAHSLGIEWTDAHARESFANVDADGNGEIDFDEFVAHRGF